MMLIGLTGSIASGKSTVANFFKELGAYIIDWDVLAREAVNPAQPAWQGIMEYFGPEVLNEDLTLNRQKLGEVIFNDAEKREQLNRIVHPAIFNEDERLTQEIRDRDPEAIIIKDAPLLIELSLQSTFDKVIVVYASEDNQVKRLMGKGLTLKEAKERIASQIPVSEKLQFADFVIYNDDSLEETKLQVEETHRLLSSITSDSPKAADV